jgi:PAS domain S-box-containing protein
MSPPPVPAITLDRHDRIVDANAEAAELLRRPVAMLLGRSFAALLSPEGRGAWRVARTLALRSGRYRGPLGALARTETPLEAVVWVEATQLDGEAAAAPQKPLSPNSRDAEPDDPAEPADGELAQPERIGLLLFDATRSVRERDELHELLSRFEFAARGGTDGLWDWRRDGGLFLSARLRRLLGLEASEAPTPRQWIRRIHPDDRRDTLRRLADCLDGTRSLFESEHRIRRSSGDWIEISLRGSARRDLLGRVDRVAGCLIDDRPRQSELRRRRRLESELTRLERRHSLGLLAEGLAHELAQPLTAIAARADALAERWHAGRPRIGGARGPDEVDPLLDVIRQEAARAIKVVRRLRAMVRPSGIVAEAIDVRLAIDDAVRIVRGDADAARVRVVHVRPEASALPPLGALGDAVLVTQAVVNLLRNGIAASAGGAAARGAAKGIDPDSDSAESADEPGIQRFPLVVVRAGWRAGAIIVRVDDDGPALSDERLRRLFPGTDASLPTPGSAPPAADLADGSSGDDGAREPAANELRDDDGLGLGLRICRGIAESLGGELRARRRSTGGLRVELQLRPVTASGKARGREFG